MLLKRMILLLAVAALMAAVMALSAVPALAANWNEEERGAPGKFSFQLILDNGAEEFVIPPASEDADVLMDL